MPTFKNTKIKLMHISVNTYECSDCPLPLVPLGGVTFCNRCLWWKFEATNQALTIFLFHIYRSSGLTDWFMIF